VFLVCGIPGARKSEQSLAAEAGLEREHMPPGELRDERDLERIFIQNNAKSVFSRIGTEELLRSAWNASDITERISATAQSNGVQQVFRQIDALASDIAFYKTRFNRLKALGGSIEQGVGSAKQEIATTYKTATARGGNITSIAQVRELIRGSEPAIRVGLEQTRGASSQVAQDVREADHILQELIAGRSLTFSEQTVSRGTTRVSEEGCVQTSQIRRLLLSGSLDGVGGLAREAGACTVEQQLSLPTGTFSFYRETSQDQAGFEIALGQAQAKQENRIISTDEARARGSNYIKTTLTQTLLASNPQLASSLAQVGISGDFVVKLMSGQSDEAIRTLGSNLLDGTLNWPLGSAQRLMQPTCKEADGPERACTKPEADSERLRTLSTVGFQPLGTELGLPDGHPRRRHGAVFAL